MKWTLLSACKDTTERDLFFDRDRYDEAAEYCDRCPVKQECLAYAETHNLVGMWGGRYLEEQAELIIEYVQL